MYFRYDQTVRNCSEVNGIDCSVIISLAPLFTKQLSDIADIADIALPLKKPAAAKGWTQTLGEDDTSDPEVTLQPVQDFR